MMKLSYRTIACGLALLPGLLAGAQQKDALAAFSDKATAQKASFTYNFKSGSLSGSGSATIMGNCFYLKAGPLEMTCNGKILWTVDKDAEEAIVEPVDTPETAGVFNPALLITCIDQAFKVKSKLSTTVGGASAVKYYLTPKSSEIEIKELVAVIAADASAIYSLTATTKDGTVTSFTIPSFSFSPKTDAKEYSISESAFGGNYIITDLR